MKPPPIRYGMYGGLAGGLVFALIMIVNGTLSNMGMMTLPLIGRLVGHSSALVGFVVHMLNSALLGAGYVLLFGRIEKGMMDGMHLGMVYGAVWWFIGPLTLMPFLLGTQIGSQWNLTTFLSMFPSFIGHIVYGAILGLTVGAARDRSLADTAEVEELRREEREEKVQGEETDEPPPQVELKPARPLFFRHRSPPGTGRSSSETD